MKAINFRISIILFIAIFISAKGAYAQSEKASQGQRTDVQELTNALSQISGLEPLSFRYSQEDIKKLHLPSGLQYGFSPEDVQQIVPGAVKTESKMIQAGKNAFRTTSVKNVDLTSLIPLLVGAIKEQQAEIENLKREIQTLKPMASNTIEP